MFSLEQEILSFKYNFLAMFPYNGIVSLLMSGICTSLFSMYLILSSSEISEFIISITISAEFLNFTGLE